MQYSPILLLHILSGTVAYLSGVVAIFLRKGSRRHALVGTVFVFSMLSLAASGVWLAVLKSQPGNILGGSFTLYLVATAWVTARRRSTGTTLFDWIAFGMVLGFLAVETTCAIEAALSPTGMKYGYSPGSYIFLGTFALLATIGDTRMLVRGGFSDAQRIARHLWRMCFAFFIAAASIFLARQHLFPKILRRTGALNALWLMPLVLMIFWLIRMRFEKARRTGLVSTASSASSPRS